MRARYFSTSLRGPSTSRCAYPPLQFGDAEAVRFKRRDLGHRSGGSAAAGFVRRSAGQCRGGGHQPGRSSGNAADQGGAFRPGITITTVHFCHCSSVMGVFEPHAFTLHFIDADSQLLQYFLIRRVRHVADDIAQHTGIARQARHAIGRRGSRPRDSDTSKCALRRRGREAVASSTA